MPWSIQKKDGQFCVIKQGDNTSEGCHKTRTDAVDHLRALYASESSNAAVNYNLSDIEDAIGHLQAAVGCTDRVEMCQHINAALSCLGGPSSDQGPMMDKPMMPMDKPMMDKPMMGDKVYYALDEEFLAQLTAAAESSDYKEYPWEGPIVFEGVTTGDNRIFQPGSITWDGDTLPWAFRWQKASIKGHDGAVPVGRVDHIERKEDGSIYGYGVIIPSLNDEAAEYLRLIEAGVASGVSVDGDSAEFDVIEVPEGPPKIVFSAMRLRSLTAVDIPAFNEARVGLVEADNQEIEEFGGKPSKGTKADGRLSYNKKKKVAMSECTSEACKRKVELEDSLVAAAIPVKPKVDWFNTPELSGPTAITVTPDGKVYGHLALFDTCHIGFPGCVTPPKGSDYKYFHTGEIETVDGEPVAVGHLTFNTGHASMSDSAKAAASHYDHTGTVAADVRAGEDKYGIWVSGALRSTLTDEDIRAFRAAPLSGDWRRIAGKLELVGALAVNTPGFPVPRVKALVASGETETLFTYSEEHFCGCEEESFSEYDLKLRREKREQLAGKALLDFGLVKEIETD